MSQITKARKDGALDSTKTHTDFEFVNDKHSLAACFFFYLQILKIVTDRMGLGSKPFSAHSL